MKTPDITPAQLVAVIGSVISVLVAFGFNLTKEQERAILDLAQHLAPFILASDALIRFGRSRNK